MTEIFSVLGSNLNPVLTQLAKTKRAVFVEGKDFQILGRFAHRLDMSKISSRSGFAVIPVEGFNPQRIKILMTGIETTLGAPVKAAAILDRDFRSEAECEVIEAECGRICEFATIHSCKEIENFLLVPAAINRAAMLKLSDRCRRNNVVQPYILDANIILEEFSVKKRDYVMAQHLTNRRRFERESASGLNEASFNEKAIGNFDELWSNPAVRLALLPGKEAISYFNAALQSEHSISITPNSVIDAMRLDEIPSEIIRLMEALNDFSS